MPSPRLFGTKGVAVLSGYSDGTRAPPAPSAKPAAIGPSGLSGFEFMIPRLSPALGSVL